MASRILLMLGLAVAATALSPTQEELSYKEAVSLAIDLYNQEPGVARAFRLLEAKPQPEWDPSIQSLQKLEFTVQETTCPPSDLNLDRCDFKGDGVVKECHGTIISEQGAPVVQYLCETAGEGLIRIRRDIRKGKKIKDRGNCNGTCQGKPLPGGGSSIANVPGGGGHTA
ncbi:PREDICTED: cathelicidin-related peptide isoform 3-like [Gekko japonicus]|uniref:Vipericidin n=1 Tax=Gekko japonicus TaxID=146911 RepID=A0ABM1KVV2_GEKJA|nr:PREDICTED: cathelicidin-related peptide isoform 3-like [Gekko japonicus]